MDVLRPQTIYIGDRCYRRNPIKFQEKENAEEYEEEEEREMIEEDVYCDEVCDAHTIVEESASGCRVSLPVPSAYFKYIIGKKGETKKRLETETQTQIRIPRIGAEGDIVIIGRDRRSVLSAKNRVDLLVESARHKQPFTHFLSFPVTDRGISDTFSTFKEDVLRFCDGAEGLDASLFQNPLKLHLTLGTLVLLSDSELQQATKLLDQCQQDIIEPFLQGEPLLTQLAGLEYMNDDLSAVDVLYAKIHLHDESERLQMVANQLVERFCSAGLMNREYDRVKLHVTLMNTRLRRDPGATFATSTGGPRQERTGTGGQPRQERESFNATEILKNYGTYNFGPYHIHTLHLSQRYSTGPDGYYSCAAQIKLP